jgi:D-glycero-alpha-D-manno-heptose-7-phosphate kinase
MQELNSHLVLLYTGIKRTASNVAETYINDIDAKRRQLRIMKDLVEESISILSNGKDIISFGELMHEAWLSKRSLGAAVSNPCVDEIYHQALSAGAVGGKLTGAGGGGFMLVFAPPAVQEEVKKKLNKLIHVPFKFEFTGSQIIFFDPQEDYSTLEKERAKQPIEAFRELEDTCLKQEVWS